MRVAILSSEVVPFAKTGGLADVAGALPKALAKNGQDAIVILPLHQQISRELLTERIDNLVVDWRGATQPITVWRSAAAEAPAYLIDAPEFFSRPSIYGYGDDHIRYALFSRAVFALFKRLQWQPEILHGNDWPCGFAVTELRQRRRYDPFFRSTRSLFSIHNAAYQGMFDAGDLWSLGYGEYPDREDFMFKGMASSFKAGAAAGDALSTVSRRYAQEIQTTEQGYGLEWLFRARADHLTGITNGVDYESWNPETDPHIAAHYSSADLSGKRQCKLDLLRRFGLPQEADRPIIAIVSRLVAQKGYDLIRQIASQILQTGSFFIALGTGIKEYEDFLQSWHDSAPARVGIYKGYAGEPLAHQIEAGADIFIMPSLYEPCGLNQMYSMRYATVPVVRATGGLDDTVENFDPATGRGNGFKFYAYNSDALLEKIREALYFYEVPDAWTAIQKNGMSVDNSWAAAAGKYIKLYEEILKS